MAQRTNPGDGSWPVICIVTLNQFLMNLLSAVPDLWLFETSPDSSSISKFPRELFRWPSVSGWVVLLRYLMPANKKRRSKLSNARGKQLLYNLAKRKYIVKKLHKRPPLRRGTTPLRRLFVAKHFVVETFRKTNGRRTFRQGVSSPRLFVAPPFAWKTCPSDGQSWSGGKGPEAQLFRPRKGSKYFTIHCYLKYQHYGKLNVEQRRLTNSLTKSFAPESTDEEPWRRFTISHLPPTWWVFASLLGWKNLECSVHSYLLKRIEALKDASVKTYFNRELLWPFRKLCKNIQRWLLLSKHYREGQV